jgi:5-methylcytosine-specific restriction endonuclease McrA
MTAYKTYSEKLTHPKWQRKRLEILNRDGFKCVLCGNEEMQLQIHHKE